MRLLRYFICTFVLIECVVAFQCSKISYEQRKMQSQPRQRQPLPMGLTQDPRTGKYEAMAGFTEEYLQDEDDLQSGTARDLFNELKGSDEALPLTKFLAWQDIVDLLERGTMDLDTIDIILSEAGVYKDELTFAQFVEVVDLVNQVASALDKAEEEELGEDEELDPIDLDELDGMDPLAWLKLQ